MGISQVSWGFIAGLLAALPASATPSINVGMKAAFPAGPYLLELLETAAQENSTAYFPLLDRISSGHFASASSDADLYAKFIDVLRDDGHIHSPETLATFKLALSLRSAAPRIEAHYQYYSTAVESALGAPADPACLDWVLLDNKQYCTPSLEKEVTGDLFNSGFKHLPFDRVVGIGKEAVLYADPTSSTFPAFHQKLSAAARNGDLSYRLRYRRNEHAPSEALPVSGYGVQLALKRTDYIVIDDREASSDSEQKPLAAGVVLDEEEDLADLKPLSTSELTSLGWKAASFILQNEKPIDALVKLTQDFPKFSASVAAHEVSENFVAESQARAQEIPGGLNFLWMNGAQLIERQVEPFALVDMVRRERKLLDGVRSLGFNGKQAIALLGHKKISGVKSGDEPVRYDWTDKTEKGNVIIWMNDLESDERYASFPRDFTSLLQHTYPGQIPPIGRNIFNLILPVDFTNKEDLAVVSQMISLMGRGIPVRFGLVPLTSNSDASAQAKIAYHILETYGTEGVLLYIQEIYDATDSAPSKKLISKVLSDLTPKDTSNEQAPDVLEAVKAEEYSQRVRAAEHWAKRLNANTPVRPVFMNGQAVPRDNSWMQGISMKLGEDLNIVQRSIFQGDLDDDTYLPGVFLGKAVARRNAYIAPENSKDVKVLDLNKLYGDHDKLFSSIPVLESSPGAARDTWAVVTVLADLSTDAGKQFLLSGLDFKRNNPEIRLDIIHNPSDETQGMHYNGALKTSAEALGKIESQDDLERLLESSKGSENKGSAVTTAAFLASSKIPGGSRVLIVNGRVVGPIAADDTFDVDDFQQLLQFEQRTRILPVHEAVEDLGLSEKLSGPLEAAKITAITALSTISDIPEGIFESAPELRTSIYEAWDSTHSAIEVGNPETSSVHIAGLLDPLSEQGQRWAPVLRVLSELDGVYLKIFLNPKEKIQELPIKRFFRYVLDSKPSFDEAGNVQPLQATFKGLPSEALLTIGMDLPPTWLVAPKVSVHDLDNIKLSSVKADVEATYELEHILIEGHSRESGKGSPPRGAQLVLATEKDPLLTDTIVMANLGYFQFKANPGFYNIQLKEGRTAEIFDIESIGAQGYAPTPGDEGTDLALMDFQGATLYPRLKRKEGMQKADVLAADEEDGEEDNIVAKGLKFAESLWGGGKGSKSTKAVSAEVHADINIFSVASGHLYERMLNIMMVSVMKHTNQTVKFWFIEQFLSPSFKDFIPHLAREHGFKYEMVTYKWPHWLRQQKEKQREIWGYKILFLDVLFPLSLDKVIFVDADQVVRTDMADLVAHDLEGAPYGFTPMCDSRTEMEGFRFWKQGYWANYLRGMPYHISALYVVDLRRFRALAAGDRLRQQYHALSADPNSLANLDQDLPNHMQFQIPIHSLPQEWLWCETWCSDESLAAARTIDLCNNPQTKEPKLDRARRQVPEWTVYDDEIAAVDRRRKQAAAGDDRPSASEEPDVNTKSRRLEEKPTPKDEL
jgi:UDP-glucose:glycoprotein glucosyltransferase